MRYIAVIAITMAAAGCAFVCWCCLAVAAEADERMEEYYERNR